MAKFLITTGAIVAPGAVERGLFDGARTHLILYNAGGRAENDDAGRLAGRARVDAHEARPA
jgi:hypothetical protein